MIPITAGAANQPLRIGSSATNDSLDEIARARTPCPAFEINQLSVFYQFQPALKNVSLIIPAQRITAVIGPSGCGKSTFLRTLNRLHDLVPGTRVEGRVRLFGTEISGPNVDAVLVRQRVGMVFQKPNPFPTMSVAQNVTIGLRLSGRLQPRDLGEPLERALRQASLWEEVKDRLHQPAASLSGGQQQRLCIARALAVEPEVLLMDEPAAALDPIATARIEDVILNLRSALTIIIVTHNLQQAARISEETAFLYLGELIEHGPTRRIFTNPRSKQTEDYVTGRFG